MRCHVNILHVADSEWTWFSTRKHCKLMLTEWSAASQMIPDPKWSPNIVYYLTHCNTCQIWSWCTEYSPSVVNRYPAINVISCVAEKNGKIKIAPSFSAIKLCFVINKLNNKTNTLLNVREYPPIWTNSSYGLVGQVSGKIPRDLAT